MNDNTPYFSEEQSSTAPLSLKLPYVPPHVALLSSASTTSGGLVLNQYEASSGIGGS
jgi:hypothetical protein